MPKKYKKVVQTLWYKKSPYTARTILKTTPLRKTVLSQLTTTTRRECSQICSCKRGDSVLCFLSVLELQDFRWRMLTRELKKKAPTLLSVLHTAAESKCFLPPEAIVGMATSMLL